MSDNTKNIWIPDISGFVPPNLSQHTNGLFTDPKALSGYITNTFTLPFSKSSIDGEETDEVVEEDGHNHSTEEVVVDGNGLSVAGVSNGITPDFTEWLAEYKKLSAFNEEEYLRRAQLQHEADLQKEYEERVNKEMEARQIAMQQFNELSQKLMAAVPYHQPLPRMKRYRPGGYVDMVATKESGNNYKAKNASSSAMGKYQFLRGTFNGLNRKYGNNSWNINNPIDQERAMFHFSKENARYLRSAGIPVNNKTMRMTHFLGQAGMKYFYDVFRRNPNASVYDALHPSNRQAVIAQNRSLLKRNGTVGALYNEMTKGFSDTDDVVIKNPDGGSIVYKVSGAVAKNNSVKAVEDSPWKYKVAANYRKTFNVKNLNSNILGYLDTLEDEYKNLIMGTSGNDRSHDENSRHYKNNAVDLAWDKKLYARIVNDPVRLNYGITLLDPIHGSGAHIHLSWGKGGESHSDVWDKARKFYKSGKGDIALYNDASVVSTDPVTGEKVSKVSNGNVVSEKWTGSGDVNYPQMFMDLVQHNPTYLLSDRGREVVRGYEADLQREKGITKAYNPYSNIGQYSAIASLFSNVPKVKMIS